MNNHKFSLPLAQARISGAAHTDSISSPALPPWRPAPRVAGRMSRVGRRQRFQKSCEASFRLLPEPIHVPLTYGRGRVQSAAGGNAVRAAANPWPVGTDIFVSPSNDNIAWVMRSKFSLTFNTVAPRWQFLSSSPTPSKTRMRSVPDRAITASFYFSPYAADSNSPKS